MRSTFAPYPARKRLAIGPARTRVRSSTRMPSSGRAGSTLPTRSRTGFGHGEPRQRFGRERNALRMCLPLADRAHLCRATAGFDDGGLERGFRPAAHRRRHRLAIGVFSEHPFGCRAMVRRVRVQADPAVAATRNLRRSDPTVRPATIRPAGSTIQTRTMQDDDRCEAFGNVPLRKLTSSATASDAAAIDALARSVTRNAEGRSPSPSKLQRLEQGAIAVERIPDRRCQTGGLFGHAIVISLARITVFRNRGYRQARA